MTTTDQQKLIEANERVAKLTAELRAAEGRRDELLRARCDNEGCDDRRPCLR